MKRVLTGLQPTGHLTLGNYIGAIKQMVKYQNEYETFIFVADMHAITMPQDPIELSKNITVTVEENILKVIPAQDLNSKTTGTVARFCLPGVRYHMFQSLPA